MLAVIFHVLHAAFLVAAEDEPHAAGKRNARVFDGLHGQQRGDGRALVVRRAAAVNRVAFHLRAEGIMYPAVAGGHDVQMRDDAHHLAGIAHFDVAGVIIKVARFEAHRRRVGEGGIEHGLQRLAEERFALGGLLFAGDANPTLEHIDYLRAQRFHRAIEFFVDHGVFLHIKKIWFYYTTGAFGASNAPRAVKKRSFFDGRGPVF